jgi:hypothetical protein
MPGLLRLTHLLAGIVSGAIAFFCRFALFFSNRFSRIRLHGDASGLSIQQTLSSKKRCRSLIHREGRACSGVIERQKP